MDESESFLKVEVHLRQSPEHRVNDGPLMFVASDDYFEDGCYHVHTDESETVIIPKENILYIWKYPIDMDADED